MEVGYFSEQSEVGIYKRKQESKKKKHALDQENYQEKNRKFLD